MHQRKMESSSSLNSKDNDGDLCHEFQRLIEQSCSLLHAFHHPLNWSHFDTANNNSGSGGNGGSGEDNAKIVGQAAAHDNDAMNVDNDNDDDEQSDSSSDDGMMMFGGGLLDSDSDDDDNNNNGDGNNNTSCGDQHNDGEYYEDPHDNNDDVEEEEEDVVMLKRASYVHDALLTSVKRNGDNSAATDTATVPRKGDVVQSLISSILSGKEEHTNNNSMNDNMNENYIVKLGNIMHNILSTPSLSSSNNNNMDILPRQMNHERKRKMNLTNSLLTIQYLLFLLNDDGDDGGTVGTVGGGVNGGSSSLLGWEMVILPILFGNTNSSSTNNNDNSSVKTIMNNDALQNAILNLITPSSISMTELQMKYCLSVCELCESAVDQLTTATTTIGNTTTTATQRQSQLVLVCDVLLRLYDGMNKQLLSKQQQQGGTGGEEALRLIRQCTNNVANSIHSSILKIIRGICYAQVIYNGVSDGDGGGEYEMVVIEPVLSLEAIRCVTGMLLPKLYGESKGGSAVEEQHQQQAVELWNEILSLLSPYSKETLSLLSPYSNETLIDDRKCCRNW